LEPPLLMVQSLVSDFLNEKQLFKLNKWNTTHHHCNCSIIAQDKRAKFSCNANNEHQTFQNKSSQSRTTMQQSRHCLWRNTPNSPPKLPLPVWRSPSTSNTLIPQPTPFTIPTTSGSNQPFCHTTLTGPQTDWHTDRLTDGLGDRSTPLALMLAWLRTTC